MTFIANTFVPSQNLPDVLRTIAEWNLVSSVAMAAREAFGNTAPFLFQTDAWSLQNPILYALIWVVAILAIFVPLSVRQYTRSMTR